MLSESDMQDAEFKRSQAALPAVAATRAAENSRANAAMSASSMTDLRKSPWLAAPSTPDTLGQRGEIADRAYAAGEAARQPAGLGLSTSPASTTTIGNPHSAQPNPNADEVLASPIYTPTGGGIAYGSRLIPRGAATVAPEQAQPPAKPFDENPDRLNGSLKRLGIDANTNKFVAADQAMQDRAANARARMAAGTFDLSSRNTSDMRARRDAGMGVGQPGDTAAYQRSRQAVGLPAEAPDLTTAAGRAQDFRERSALGITTGLTRNTSDLKNRKAWNLAQQPPPEPPMRQQLMKEELADKQIVRQLHEAELKGLPLAQADIAEGRKAEARLRNAEVTRAEGQAADTLEARQGRAAAKPHFERATELRAAGDTVGAAREDQIALQLSDPRQYAEELRQETVAREKAGLPKILTPEERQMKQAQLQKIVDDTGIRNEKALGILSDQTTAQRLAQDNYDNATADLDAATKKASRASHGLGFGKDTFDKPREKWSDADEAAVTAATRKQAQAQIALDGATSRVQVGLALAKSLAPAPAPTRQELMTRYNFLAETVKAKRHPKTGQPLTDGELRAAKEKMEDLWDEISPKGE